MDTMYQSLVSVEPATLMVTILNLFLQMFLVKKFLLDRVLAVLDQRRAAADKEISEAERAKQEALDIKNTYEENMRRAKDEAGNLLARAQHTANLRSEEIVLAAEQQAVQIRQKAMADIAQEKKKAINDAKDEISDMAMAIATKVVGRTITREDQSRLVDSFIDELGDSL